MARAAIAALVGLPLPSIAQAQFGFSSQFELSSAVQLNEPDNQTSKHLERVKAFLADEQWDDAVETLRQLMESDGDRVLPLAPGRYTTIRNFCHARIAALPPAALKLYRDRVDALARRWYEAGIAERDRAALERVVNQCFASSWGDNALLAIGELALERGQYGAARDAWERISPLLRTADGRPLWLALSAVDLEAHWKEIEPLLVERPGTLAWIPFLDTELDLADVRARLVLVSILEGNQPRARLELDIFQRLHRGAEGQLGGRKVKYADALRELLLASSRWPDAAPRKDWPTFGGSPARDARLPRAYRLAGPAWANHISLGEPLLTDTALARSFGFGGRPVAEDFDGLLSYHPLVVNDLVLLNDQTRVLAFNLHTGEPAWKEDGGEIYKDEILDKESGRASARPGRLGVPRFTMTAVAGKLLVRMGDPVTSWPPESPREGKSGYIACLDLEDQGRLLWQIGPGSAEWAFEGSPTSDGARLYVAMRRSDVRPQAYVACFDMQTGKRLWRTRICAAETPARGQVDEVTHNLLTLSEDTIYYNTNLGAVAAVSALDGQIRWVSLYPRATRGDLSRRAAHLYRDLNPCVVSQGTLLVAPLDSEQILAMDAATGGILWASDLPDDVVHLLGVRGDHLLASGDRLWWLHVHTGKVVRRWPESKQTGPRGYGRGAIAGNEVYWPSRDRIWVFDCRTAEQTQEPISLAAHNATGGNLLLVDGYLLIAGSDKLYGFSQFPRRREALERDVTAHPKKAAPHYRLAQCEEAMQRPAEALKLYRKTLELAQRDEQFEGQSLTNLTQQRVFKLLRGEAAAAAETGRRDEAVGLWRQAAEFAVADGDRLTVGLWLGDALLAAEQSVEAARQFQSLLLDPKLVGLPVTVSPERSLQARRVLAGRIEELIGVHGQAAYSEVEAAATAALAAAEKEGNASEIQRLANDYPNSSAARAALAKLAVGLEQQRKTSSAQRVWRQLAQIAPRLTVAQLPVELPPVQLLGERGADASVASYVTARMAAARLADAQPAAAPQFGLPMQKVWDQKGNQPLLLPGGRAPHQTATALLSGGDPGVSCLALADGKTLWTAALSGSPAWAYHDRDQLLIGTTGEVAAVDESSGHARWRWNGELGAKGAMNLVGFAWHEGRILVGQGQMSLTALEAATGAPVWSHAPDRRVLRKHWGLVGDRLLLQQEEAAHAKADAAKADPDDAPPVQTLVLRAADGAVLWQWASHDGGWTREPIALDESHAITVTAAHRVELVDVEAGEVIWSRSPSNPSSSLQSEALVRGDVVLMVSDDGEAWRLDPVDGSDLWSEPARLGAASLVRPNGWAAIDDRAVYCVSSGELVAIGLADGRTLWRQPLAADPVKAHPVAQKQDDRLPDETKVAWRVELLGPYVLAHPAQFDESRVMELVFAQAADGQMVHRSPTIAATTGEARVSVAGGWTVVQAPDHLWVFSTQTPEKPENPPKLRVSNK